jgi:hypothetical protein
MIIKKNKNKNQYLENLGKIKKKFYYNWIYINLFITNLIYFINYYNLYI